ncbi:MAG TPA: lipopolysaccharide biosynthesis protein [Polyangiaceae bacterium]|nr:lipopolysaccharide biosynthesis protein [Polyangiaceae bacterium]
MLSSGSDPREAEVRTSLAAKEPDAASATAPDVTRSAGRGGLAVAFAKLYFILQGLIQQVALPRVLGLDGYGALSSVLSIASIAYNPVTTTSIQGVSRAVAQSTPENEAATIRRTLSIHAALAVFLAAVFFFLAPPLGDWVGAPHVVGGLRILSGVMLLYGFYTPLVGVLNGQKKFLYQAGLDILTATLRTGGLIFGAYWFARRFELGVEGATLGFVGAAALVLCVALALVGVGKPGVPSLTLKQHVSFILPLLLGQALLNLLLQADLTLLRSFAADAAVRANLPLRAADPLVGAYRATQLFSFLPYQMLIAITFILFPLLASAHRTGDRAAVARYVQTGVRLALVLAGLMVSVTSGLSGPLLRLVFPAEAAELGTRTMQLATLGFGAFAILGILTTVLNSLNRERASAGITATAFALVVLLCFLRVRGGPFGEELLWRTALATSSGLVLATLAAAFLVKRTAGAVVPPLSLVRVLVAMAVAIGVGRVLPYQGKLVTLIYAATVATIYVAALLLSRELTRADANTVKAVIRRKR